MIKLNTNSVHDSKLPGTSLLFLTTRGLALPLHVCKGVPGECTILVGGGGGIFGAE